jgi:hypothetical protein
VSALQAEHVVREIEGVPSLQREDFDAVAATVPPGLTFVLQCGACAGRLMFVNYLPKRRVLALRCGNCGAPATSPIIPESAATAGGEIPIVTAPPPPEGLPS